LRGAERRLGISRHETAPVLLAQFLFSGRISARSIKRMKKI